VPEFNKKQLNEIAQAQRVIAEGEVVLDVTTGLGKVRRMGQETSRRGALIVTDRRVIFFTKKLGGYEMSDHVWAMLTAIDYKKGVMFGNINLNASGDHYHISSIPKDDIERVAQLIRSQMGQVRAHATHAAPAAPDLADQIRKLGDLRDSGLLSDDEFQAKKRQLLEI
jgi:hypothetical protein